MCEVRKRAPDPGHFLAVEGPRGDQHAPGPQLQALPHGFRPEGRKQGAKHASVLEGSQHRNIQLRAPAHEGKDAFRPAYPELRQDCGKPAGLLGKFAVAEGMGGPVSPDKPQGLVACPGACGMAVHGLVRDVEAPAGKPGQRPAGTVP
nr:hypothetical protein GCM10017547_15240 [Pseudarthrobacter oxydans]